MQGVQLKFIAGFVTILLTVLAGSKPLLAQKTAGSTTGSLVQKDDVVDVRLGDDLFTSLRTNEFAKPILFPVYASGQIAVTRSSPMAQVPGEANDHPHHKSIWFAHGDVNGVDFWSEKGAIKTTQVVVDAESFSIKLNNDWLAGDKRICRDETTYAFGFTSSERWIDFDITLVASDSDLRLGDTKEGMWAIRTRPGMQLTADPKNGVPEVFGKASNSEGETGTAIWGKQAKWVLYEGKLDGVAISMVMMDHPDNLRHPTTWHARDYGLVAANPFGRHDFLGEAKGAGEHRVAQGQLLRFRYRILFANTEQHPFDPSAEFQRYVEHTK